MDPHRPDLIGPAAVCLFAALVCVALYYALG